jgi:hypothetical protein
VLPETACDQVRDIICKFATSYYKLIYFHYDEGFKKEVVVPISSDACCTSATHTHTHMFLTLKHYRKMLSFQVGCVKQLVLEQN